MVLAEGPELKPNSRRQLMTSWLVIDGESTERRLTLRNYRMCAGRTRGFAYPPRHVPAADMAATSE